MSQKALESFLARPGATSARTRHRCRLARDSSMPLKSLREKLMDITSEISRHMSSQSRVKSLLNALMRTLRPPPNPTPQRPKATPAPQRPLTVDQLLNEPEVPIPTPSQTVQDAVASVFNSLSQARGRTRADVLGRTTSGTRCRSWRGVLRAQLRVALNGAGVVRSPRTTIDGSVTTR